MPCSTCDVRACIRGGHYPDTCTADLCTPDMRDHLLELYAAPEYHAVMRAAYKTILQSTAAKWPRVQEIVTFAHIMGFTKIGIASCISFAHETEMLATLLRDEGFEVVGAMCKMATIRRSDVGIPPDPEKHDTIICALKSPMSCLFYRGGYFDRMLEILEEDA